MNFLVISTASDNNFTKANIFPILIYANLLSKLSKLNDHSFGFVWIILVNIIKCELTEAKSCAY